MPVPRIIGPASIPARPRTPSLAHALPQEDRNPRGSESQMSASRNRQSGIPARAGPPATVVGSDTALLEEPSCEYLPCKEWTFIGQMGCCDRSIFGVTQRVAFGASPTYREPDDYFTAISTSSNTARWLMSSMWSLRPPMIVITSSCMHDFKTIDGTVSTSGRVWFLSTSTGVHHFCPPQAFMSWPSMMMNIVEEEKKMPNSVREGLSLEQPPRTNATTAYGSLHHGPLLLGPSLTSPFGPLPACKAICPSNHFITKTNRPGEFKKGKHRAAKSREKPCASLHSSMTLCSVSSSKTSLAQLSAEIIPDQELWIWKESNLQSRILELEKNLRSSQKALDEGAGRSIAI
ncbi:hypothetical protein BDK51DRAFT_43311 [Blyttiomyces helicus]|uniref:Uncharacterized protein n=1 Tax=Blyttiomyces helicus TaxID=388810 RepID=A0A4P9WF01_9FUNG|nr:hypothetical protein BDK51DRAFT_43311 [Blyttiomyces helicus]|eukprot:RKO89580.1 hypothetical protein BDK51DRAFT_43311 [Blyttiomyces helicus]